jgi:hypothetical protein
MRYGCRWPMPGLRVGSGNVDYRDIADTCCVNLAVREGRNSGVQRECRAGPLKRTLGPCEGNHAMPSLDMAGVPTCTLIWYWSNPTLGARALHTPPATQRTGSRARNGFRPALSLPPTRGTVRFPIRYGYPSELTINLSSIARGRLPALPRAMPRAKLHIRIEGSHRAVGPRRDLGMP